MNLNKSILIGRLTRDPEMKHTASGVAVTQFGLAVDDGYGEQKKTVFLDVTCWKQTAEFVAQYVRKGHPVCVDGRLSMDQWEDRETGQKRSKLYVTANGVQSLQPREQPTQPPATPFPTDQGDIPFA
jgi:single-strand DNA-binding protein